MRVREKLSLQPTEFFKSRSWGAFIVLILCLATSNTVWGQEESLLEPGEEPPGENISLNLGERTEITFGGAIWAQVLFNEFEQRETNARRGIHGSQFRISVSGSHTMNAAKNSKWIFSGQMRVFSFMTTLNHMWIGYQFNDHHKIQVGATDVPFGILPSTSNSFWFSTGWYHGLEFDVDAGVSYRYTKGPLDIFAAYFANEEYNNASLNNRFSPDLINDGDMQQNEEKDQFNGRIAYTLGHGTSYNTEIGISGEYGSIYNRLTDGHGDHWKAAAHIMANYDRWNFKAQFARFEWRPNNPEGVDDDLILMGFWESPRLIAAKGNAMTVALKRYLDTGWENLPKVDVYFDYSRIFKDAAGFADTELLNPGFVLHVGPVFLWNDFIFARNGWWMNDSFENPGHGAGGIRPEKWEFRYNLEIMFFF